MKFRFSFGPRTADSIIASFTDTVKDLENHAASQLELVARHQQAVNDAVNARHAASVEAGKASLFAKKLTDLFA